MALSRQADQIRTAQVVLDFMPSTPPLLTNRDATITWQNRERTDSASAFSASAFNKGAPLQSKSPTLTQSQGVPLTGVVAGFVLKLARRSACLTQESLAESLQVDVTTIQGWESGRRPLAAVQAGDVLRLGSRLAHLGAPASTRRHLREAMEADLVLSTGVAAAATWVGPEAHPLAGHVHRRSLTNLITWPLTGDLPPQLIEFTPKIPNRGPTALRPRLTIEATSRFLDHLMTVVEHCKRPQDALLRRQAVYLLGFDKRPHVADWLRGEWDRASRRPVAEGDVTALMEARSASVTLAATGDGGRLHDFLGVTSGASAEVANLNYWAHWVGESADEHSTDDFMRDENSGQWHGVRLLRHLIDRLVPDSAHLPLNLHTMHSLVASRPALLTDSPRIRPLLSEALDRITSAGTLTRTGRTQVAGLHYALRLAER
ncbi:helix-turn-helix transcriptional regulator [Actinokineospora iranica]|uniref:HTH cro/C1-type domain-containing protein n=1 Tax=Actinokineospora iranica TaxID=1271860 RepID=A0A1G6M6S8_9PSEU|nr:helix-turn-helix transcriptional regulator [Actinokineospora iranica]SDC50655.1 hypothetical protein SAMN05216174_102380 [Actinokineospora iranica]